MQLLTEALQRLDGKAVLTYSYELAASTCAPSKPSGRLATFQESNATLQAPSAAQPILVCTEFCKEMMLSFSSHPQCTCSKRLWNGKYHM